MEERRAWRAWVGFLVAVAFVGWSEGWVRSDPSASPMAVLDCRTAVFVDGALHCGSEAAARTRSCPMGTVSPGAILDPADPCVPRGYLAPNDARALGIPIDVNRAPRPLLESLPGVGPVTAERIEQARPFHEPNDLLRVRGIGEKRLANMRDRVRLQPVTPGDSGAQVAPASELLR